MLVKALTFDIVGTAFDWFGSFASGVPPLAQKWGRKLDPSAFALAAEQGYAAGVQAVLAGHPWTPPDQILQNSIVALVSAGHPASPAEAADFFNLWRTFDPWPDVQEGLCMLKQRFTLAILSNMSAVTQADLRAHAGLPFDHTLSAETVKTYKPSPAVYQMAISALALPPDQIMMVAAHKYDLQAAKALGLRTAFVARPLESGPAGHPDTTPDPAFDLNVTSFTELALKLGASPLPLQEDCLALNPSAAQAQLIAGTWKVTSGQQALVDFGSNQANATKALDIIRHYGLDRICFVQRPHPPMTYFTVKGAAPQGPYPGEDAIPFNLAHLRTVSVNGSWIVTDGVSRLLDFGPDPCGAVQAIAILKRYGFTTQCFVGRPNAPMMYFRK